MTEDFDKLILELTETRTKMLRFFDEPFNTFDKAKRTRFEESRVKQKVLLSKIKELTPDKTELEKMRDELNQAADCAEQAAALIDSVIKDPCGHDRTRQGPIDIVNDQCKVITKCLGLSFDLAEAENREYENAK